MSALELGGFALLFAFYTALSAHRYRSLLAPAVLWNGAWTVLFMSTAILGYGFSYPLGGVLALVLMVSLFNVPGFLLSSTVRERRIGIEFATPPMWLIVVAGIVALAGVVQLSVSLGTSILSIRSFDQLLSAGQQNAAAIFRGEATFGAITNVTFAALQLAFALAGMRFALKPGRSLLIATLTLVGVAFLWASVTTQRSYLLVPVVWFVAGYVASIVLQGKRAPTAKSVLIGAALVIALLAAVVFLRSVRTSGTGAEFSEASFAPTRLWLAGYVPTFAVWFEQTLATSLSAGVLGGVYALFGSVLGIRGDDGGQGAFYPIGSGMTSNTGTAFMAIVGSGGLLWGCLIIVLLGFAAHLVYRRAAEGGIVATTGYIGVVAGILWATNAWFFSYGGRVFALLLLLLFGLYAARRGRKEKAFHAGGGQPGEDGVSDDRRGDGHKHLRKKRTDALQRANR